MLAIKVKPKTTTTKPLVISIPKEVLPQATKRNLLRRRIRSIMRPFLKDNKAFTFFVRRETARLSYQELKEAVSSSLKKTHL